MSSTVFAYLLMISFLVFTILTFYFGVKKRGRRIFLAAIYLLGILFVSYQGLYYAHNFGGTSPDETAHISYIYYLNVTDEIIPTFEDMHLFSSYVQKWSDNYYEYQEDTVNYVCHPPLYYQIMRLAGGFSETEDSSVIAIDKNRIRHFSMCIHLIGLILLLYIGYSRITRSKPWLHLLYVTACTSIPMLAYELCAVTNDALALVTGCICIIGLIRFSEKKRGYLTYILIASGITASLLTKLTTALLCIIMAILILGYSLYKERSIKKALPYEFWVTAPIYVIAIFYYIIIYSRYHAIQPSLELICSTEYFQSTIYYTEESARVVMDKSQYLMYYLNKFFLSWSGIEGSVNLTKLTTFSKATLPSELLWIFPVLLMIPRARKLSGHMSLPVFSGWISCLITFLIQIKSAYGSYLSRGYLGGFQSRYYLPFLFAFGMGAVFVFQSAQVDSDFDGDTETLTVTDIRTMTNKILYNNLIYLIALGYAFLLFYGNFPFFLMHFADVLMGTDFLRLN